MTQVPCAAQAVRGLRRTGQPPSSAVLRNPGRGQCFVEIVDEHAQQVDTFQALVVVTDVLAHDEHEILQDKLAGVSPAYLSRLERGRRRLTADVADRLEAVLDATPIRVPVSWRELRQRADLSLREVARRSGVDAAVLSRVERGRETGDGRRGAAAGADAGDCRAAALSSALAQRSSLGRPGSRRDPGPA